MEVNPEQLINGLLDEIKRLTVENVALKTVLNQVTSAVETVKIPEDLVSDKSKTSKTA